MHEFSLVENILKSAIGISQEQGNLPITRVVLEIGALQQVVPEALEFAFQAAKQDTLADGAEFEWSEVPALVRCASCGHEYVPDNVFWVCPQCSATGGNALQGDEITLISIELEDSEN